MSEVDRYPLAWPLARPRTNPQERKRAPFGSKGSNGYGRRELTIAEARHRLEHEVELAGGEELIISSNLILNRDGSVRSGQREPVDVGVAVYFILERRPVVFACDVWDRAADNVAAIAKHIESLRGQERWGVGTLAQAFAGYVALPPPSSGEKPARPWREVMGFGPNEDIPLRRLGLRYRSKAIECDGDEDALRELNVACDEAREELSR